ncbi:unnamed protein product [Porites evermanni]|uniref:Serine/threonine-protein phosphatase 4 regulatory subunit 4 n=1 Tax=Porites evermanni TaxID=104178 RepID=A0ABN8QQ28_9CNID|nr:unnamed protein product [Porites evermanni]
MASLGALVGGPLGEEDVEELRSERSIRGLKSQEEIERLTVDENLDDIERAVLLLSSGVEIQKLSIINNLPRLLEKNSGDVNRRILPVLREYLYIAPLHVQLEATKSFSSIIENGTIQAYMFASSLLPIILHNLDSRDTVVSNAWLQTLLTSIDFLPKDVIKREVLGIAISKGQLSQSVNCRLASCKLLGKIAPKFETYWIKKELMALVASLCQDVDYEVRACMCQQLETIARALGLESTQSIIIPELVELTNDEETSVRLAGLETITNLLSLLDDDTCTAVIIPLVQKFCDEIPKQCSDSLLMVAKLFGKLSYGLSVNLDDTKKKWFLEFYKRMCFCGNPNKNNRVGSVTLALKSSVLSGATIDDDPEAECRRCCAFNFPAMLLFCGASGFQAELAATFHSLVEDPHALVRRTIACGFHEVAKLLGTNVGTIQQDLSILLKDESIEVLEGLIPNLPQSLECLARGGHSTLADTKLNNLSNLIPSLIACELAVDSSSNWRLHVESLEKFSCFPKCLTSDQIYYKFVPLFFRLLSSNRVLPVKLAAAHTLCVFIRYNRRYEQRQELCCRLIQECGRGKSYRSRLLFIDICKFIMELFSRRFFKENFFEFLLELGSDPVLNVRLKFCTIPPLLKSLLKLPTDRHLLQQLEQCIRKLLSSEKEPDVCTAVRETFMKLDKTKYEEDIMDQRKEEEERLLIVMEEKEKEEMAGANKISDPRKKGSKDDKSKKGVASKGKGTKGDSLVALKRTPSNSGPSASSKTTQKTAPARSLGTSTKSSPSSSLQRLPSLSSALPLTTSGPSPSTSSGSSWRGSPNASTQARSSVTSAAVKTTGKTTKDKTTEKSTAGKNKKSIPLSSGNYSRGGF